MKLGSLSKVGSEFTKKNKYTSSHRILVDIRGMIFVVNLHYERKNTTLRCLFVLASPQDVILEYLQSSTFGEDDQQLQQ